MVQQFLSIKEAQHDYVVSETTLRRRAREIVRDPSHQFRQLVQPTPVEFERLKQQNMAYEYQISTQLLDLKYEKRSATDDGTAGVTETRADVNDAAMGMLEQTQGLLKEQLRETQHQIRELNDQLRAKDRQLDAKDDQLKRRDDEIERRGREVQDLNVSIRTLSLSINELQKRLPQSVGNRAAEMIVEEGLASQAKVAETERKAPAKKQRGASAKGKAGAKRGVLGRWFGASTGTNKSK